MHSSSKQPLIRHFNQDHRNPMKGLPIRRPRLHDTDEIRGNRKTQFFKADLANPPTNQTFSIKSQTLTHQTPKKNQPQKKCRNPSHFSTNATTTNPNPSNPSDSPRTTQINTADQNKTYKTEIKTQIEK